jgi:hypothetical protein
MDSLAEIMARVERLAFAREEERSASLSVLSSPSSLEPATLPLDLPLVEVLTPPEYIQAEAFLEVSGYFTPSSKRIKGTHIPSDLVVTHRFSHHTLALAMGCPHHVSSAPTAICMEMRHGPDRQNDTQKPHDHR